MIPDTECTECGEMYPEIVGCVCDSASYADGLEKMLKVDLLSMASHIESITGEGNMTKAELIEAIRANR